jgi:cytochrome c peroxidase
VIVITMLAFKKESPAHSYLQSYTNGLEDFERKQQVLLKRIHEADLSSEESRRRLRQELDIVRVSMKQMDLWLRYLEPISYKQINGPLPVEWETEVFEKFEKPYRREGAGLTLAVLYLEEEVPAKDSLIRLVSSSLAATRIFREDSITTHLNTFDHFFLCNRLFLLNLAAIYTTGFECPDPERIIPELRHMMRHAYAIYSAYNESFPDTPLNEDYLALYRQAGAFVNQQPDEYLDFDHFSFIKDYVNPLFAMNQRFIRDYKAVTKSYVDYSLSKQANSIFSKSLYKGQNAKGLFLRVYDEKVLSEIERLGKLLFYDPILSGNNLRSCASCHKPEQFFTDTALSRPLQFNREQFLPRNSPSLINVPFNHLIMADGQHISLQDQTRSVITNSLELACAEQDVLKKILSCKEYKAGFSALLKYTPQQPRISMEHISSAITLYYSKFSRYQSPFDLAVNSNKALTYAEKAGFNLFMGKAQCGTCHFVPHFNGVKPPYVGSEFEVLGVPGDTAFLLLSQDQGRYLVNPADETMNAFRTGTLRNIEKTAPYMHNGVFKTLNQVIDFYDAGGGAGRGLPVPNQTLSADSLHLSAEEKSQLLAFMRSLTEDVIFEKAPSSLPLSRIKHLNQRKTGGEY